MDERGTFSPLLPAAPVATSTMMLSERPGDSYTNREMKRAGEIEKWRRRERECDVHLVSSMRKMLQDVS